MSEGLPNQSQSDAAASQPKKLVIPTIPAGPAVTEVERMISDQLFNFQDPELVAGRYYASSILKRLNSEELQANVNAIAPELFGTVGAGTIIKTPFRCMYGSNIHLARRVFVNVNRTILNGGAVTIGDDSLFGPNVSIYTVAHMLPVHLRKIIHAKPVKIAADCWIGADVIILWGVSAGEGAVVGAGAVVTKDVAPFTVVAGNPARKIKDVPLE